MPNNKALEIRKKYCQRKPPVNAMSIAKKMGIVTRFYDHPLFNFPFAIKQNSHFTICLPIVVDRYYYNYYAAKELGHIVLGHLEHAKTDSLTKDRLTPQLRDGFEQEAQIFADNLLMPTEWLWKAYNLHKNVHELSDELEVPINMLLPRIQILEIQEYSAFRR